MNPETALITRNSAQSMAEGYDAAVADIQEGYGLLIRARERLSAAFEGRVGFRVEPSTNSSIYADTAEKVIKGIRQDAWRAIIEKTELKKLLSQGRSKKLSEAIENDELPELTADNMAATVQSWAENVEEFLGEAVREVYDFLRPGARTLSGSEYVTNQKNGTYDLGKKVIIGYALEEWGRYGQDTFRIQYSRRQDFKNVENVFRLLEGKGVADASYRGELVDAIEASEDGYGETEYFKFRACKNGNLHLEFKRLDLVKELNAVAGGAKLKRDSS